MTIMICSLVWTDHNTRDGQTQNHRAHYLFRGYYMTIVIYFIGLDFTLEYVNHHVCEISLKRIRDCYCMQL